MKRFRTTYIVALVIVAIFVILAEIAVQLGFTASEEDARLINIASRQRALVQKIAKSSVILSQTTNVDTFQIYKKELAESLDLWQKSHQALLKGDLVIGIKSPKNSPATIQRFQDLQPFYEQIQTAAMAIAANDYSLVISDETKKLEIKNNTGIILENEAKYFPIMNEIVDQYEKEAKGRTDTTALIAWSVGIIILGVLVLLAIFYFAPISKKLENFVEEIENKNKKLAASEMELRKISEEQLKLNEDLFIAQKQAQEQNEKLKQAEEETRKALERQERTNQKLLVAQRELQKTLIEQNRINQQLIAAQEEAEKKRKELEKNEQEMRMLAEAQLEANEKLLLAQKQEEKVRQELAITAQKQEALNRILQKSILTNSSNFNEFLEHSIDVLSEIKFLELLPGVGIFLKKEGESEVYEMVRQKNISPKIQELCHNIKTGQCLCGLAIKTKETQYAHCVDERHTIRFEGIKEHGHYNIPILYQEEALGAVVVYLPHGHKREQAEINFLEAVANIIASTYIKVKNEKELQATLEKVARSEQEMRMLAEAQLEANEKLLLAQKQEEKVRQELAITAQKQEALNRILQKSILTNSSNFNEFLEHSIDVLSEIKFLELLPGVGIFLKKEGESEVYEMVRQKNISPKIQELCHNIKTGQCLCGLAIKTKETQYAHCVDERHTIRFEGIKEHGHYNIPILYQEEALGAVVVYLPHGHKREQAEINFLEAVANIIASTYIKVKNEKELQATLEKVARSEQEMRMLAEAQLEANEKLLLAQKQEEKVRQELAITAQKQEALNRILQKSILTNSSNFNEFLEHSIDVLSEIKFLELLPGVGIFLKKEGESEVYEMVRQKNISPKIQELCHNIKTGQCLCGLAIKTKETQYAHCVDERHTIRFEGIEEHGHYNIPILYQEEALGAVVVYLPHGHKREQAEINFLEAVANIIASTYIKVKNEKELQATLEKVARSEQEMRLLAEAQLEANEKLLLAQREAEKSKKELEETLEQQKVITSSLVLAQKEISRRAEELEKAEREMRQLAEAQIEANEKLILAQKIEKERTAKIEKYNAILTNLSTTPFEKYENLEKALQAITEAVAEGLGIERASIWDYTGTSLVSKDLFEKTKNQHSAGLELFAKDFPAYFEGVQSGLAIVAHNAHTHPNTFEFSEVYLKPLGINSMLDVPIRVAGELKGVVCCEYVGTDFKEWTLEDENFARSISEIISLMIEADKRKKAEKELQIAFESLKKSQKEIERLALVASKTDNAIIITDANGFIEWANEGFERLTEYKLEEVKGKKPGSFLQGEKTNPADVFAIRQGIASLKSFYQEIYNYSKSGRGYWLGINITPLFDEQNNLTGFIAIESDITERKQVEIELQNALEKARRAEEDMRALAEAQLEANERLMMAEKQLKETLELEKKQKEELDRLVAQLKETQGQLVHNEKMASLGQLTAGIAHEINNPINFVYNGIDTLKISLDDLMEIVKKYNELDSANGNKEEIIQQAKELKEQLGFEELTQDIEHLVADIKKGAIRTMEIVKGLRIFSRLDEEERKMANIKEALESTLILLNNKMKGRIEVKKYYDETMPEILCYPGQLNQVFMNILNNAIQAIPEDRKDGEITIYTENQAENVIIRIKDNGVGMSEQVKRRIFEPFFTTKPVGVGTGLGLSITFGIIEKHGGQIFVNSEEGKGTEFVIQLPKERI